MAPRTPVVVRQVTTTDEMTTVLRLRHQVFVVEQGVPQELEEDADDARARHYLAFRSGAEAVGTARLVLKPLQSGKIGRVAVLPEHRGAGLGAALVRWLVEEARGHGCRELILDAQISVIRFYERLGFAPEGEEFLDAGIRHRRMRRRLEGDDPGEEEP
jgi:predicted GNAT family N-acyltransferase